jgi:hypothetical protein
MKPSPLRFIFTIEVDGKPTVAFEAKNLREASELCKEGWFRADLSALTSNGSPLCNATAKLKVRSASGPEQQMYADANNVVQASDDLVLAYLVDLDELR